MSARRASEERRPGEAGEDDPDGCGLAARPDGQEDAEDDENDDERQGQEDDRQDDERNGPTSVHGLLPFFPILGRSRPPVNKKEDGVIVLERRVAGRSAPRFFPHF
jgi:hypothetical protein